MPKFNKNIRLWIANNSGESKTFYAYYRKDGNEEKSIEGLFKRMLFPNRFDYPIARIYVNESLKKSYLQGIEVKNNEKRCYGPDISKFKIKLIVENEDSTEFVGPFYSNSLVDIETQFDLLIDEYCKRVYRNRFINALIIYLGNKEKESLFANVKYNKKLKKLVITKNFELW